MFELAVISALQGLFKRAGGNVDDAARSEPTARTEAKEPHAADVAADGTGGAVGATASLSSISSAALSAQQVPAEHPSAPGHEPCCMEVSLQQSASAFHRAQMPACTRQYLRVGTCAKVSQYPLDIAH